VLRDPLVLAGYVIAVLATLLLIRHVARLWPNAPPRIPLQIGLDGRPRWLAPRGFVWLAPAIVAAVVIVLGFAVAATPPDGTSAPALFLVFLTIAEVCGLVGWTTGLQVQLGRNQTYRIAPIRLLRAAVPILLTVLAAVYVGATG